MQVLTLSTHHYLQVINLRKTQPQKPEELPDVAATTAVSAPAASVPSHLAHWLMSGAKKPHCMHSLRMPFCVQGGEGRLCARGRVGWLCYSCVMSQSAASEGCGAGVTAQTSLWCLFKSLQWCRGNSTGALHLGHCKSVTIVCDWHCAISNETHRTRLAYLIHALTRQKPHQPVLLGHFQRIALQLLHAHVRLPAVSTHAGASAHVG